MTADSPPLCSLTDPTVLAEPYPLYDLLRREDPVHWSEALQGWVLTRHADVLAALRDPRLSSRRSGPFVRLPQRDADPTLAPDFARVVGRMMLMADGADHQRLRALGGRGLGPTVLNQARPMIQHAVDELLDRVADRLRLDVVADLARPLPAAVAAELFGIPAADRAAFQTWSADAGRFFAALAGDPAETARKANAAAVELERYFLGLLGERRRAPRTDLMSLVLASQADGPLADEDVCCQCILLLIASHIIVDQLGNAVYALLTHPDQMDLLRADPDLAAAAVEEALRYDAAVPFLHRVACADLEVGGRTIRAGQLVYLGLAAANRDPAAFADPDRFDLLRTNNRHVTFGAGLHLCLGAGLTRRQLAAVLRTLPRRLPGLRLDPRQPPRRQCDSLSFRGFATLPVVFS